MTPTKDQQAQEYAEKKIESEYGISREDFVEAGCRFGYNDVVQAYLDGYTAAEQSMTDSEATMIQGWVARDKGGMLRLHYTKPKRTDGGYWQGGFKSTYMPIGRFPSLTWSDEPIECEIIIKPKKR